MYLTGGGGGRLAAHAGWIDRLGRNQVQVLVIRDLVEAVTVFEQLDVQILIDLLM
uniref:Si:dkey-201c13.2 n=1 Tax=Cynoglossus semilaevis TaxID=244447 RepID=A0A3P8VUW6_CYNSE